jgi:hypothetical protein
MLTNLWNKLMGRSTARAVEREAEEEQMSPAERHFVDESLEEHNADVYVEEHGMLGERPLDIDDHPPR